ncbi:pentatricopeptide repeat-containing protein, partial [Tanacetum coccineum]
ADGHDLEDVSITMNRGDGDDSKEDKGDNTERHEDYDLEDIDDMETDDEERVRKVITLFKNPLSYSQLGLRFCPHNTFLASQIHSNTCSANVDGNTQSIYQKVSNLDDALYLFDQMSQRRPLPSVVKFNQLLHSLSKIKHHSHSIRLFKQMCALRVPVDDYTMNIITKCCCQLYRTNEAFAVFAWNFKRGIIPHVVTFNTLLNGLVLEDRIVEAEIFFKKLIKQKLCEPNVVMYSTMIKGLCKFGISATAISLLRLMDERGCKPNVVTYNNIIDSLCVSQY